MSEAPPAGEGAAPEPPPEPGASPPPSGTRAGRVAGGCAGFVLALLAGSFAMIGGIGWTLNRLGLSNKLGLVFGVVLAIVAFASITRLGWHGFRKGALIGAGVAALLYGICSTLY